MPKKRGARLKQLESKELAIEKVLRTGKRELELDN